MFFVRFGYLNTYVPCTNNCMYILHCMSIALDQFRLGRPSVTKTQGQYNFNVNFYFKRFDLEKILKFFTLFTD